MIMMHHKWERTLKRDSLEISFIINWRRKIISWYENSLEEKYIRSLDQDQCVKNIIARFEKAFKYPFIWKQSPLPTNFTPSKKDGPTTEE